MLSTEDNEILVRVGPGTAMGQLMRLYWIPFLPAKDSVADGMPVRVRLLGADLLAFRDSEGRTGLIDQSRHLPRGRVQGSRRLVLHQLRQQQDLPAPVVASARASRRCRRPVSRIRHLDEWLPNVALPIRYSGTPLSDPRPAPDVGGHTRGVLREVLGYDDARLDALTQAGAFGEPRQPHEPAETPP